MKITDISLEDKILQTLCVRLKPGVFDPRKFGAAFFFGEIITDADEMGLDNARKFLHQYVENADIPLLVTSDFENGCGSMLKGLTPFPLMMGLGATNSEEIAYNYGKATALEARSVGANWTFSPVCDLNVNPRNPLVNVRGMTDDPDLACRLLRQVIRGMQDNGLAACAKHFPGDGMDYRDQHIVTTNNTLPFEEWKKMHGRVFREVIEEGVDSIMVGHITLPDYQKEVFKNGMKLPATQSKEMVTDLLKGELDFKGVVVTDALGMGGFLGWREDRRHDDIEAFRAGNDMMLWPSEHYVDDMKEAVENGYVPMERLDDAVGRILELKQKLGLFDHDNHPIKLTKEQQQFVLETQKQAAEHSVTLLRDNMGAFPLSTEKYKKIAVVPITHHAPAFEQAELLCTRLRERGFEVDMLKESKEFNQQSIEEHDLVIVMPLSRPFRPMGFLDFMKPEASKVATSLKYGTEKTIIACFGSPYFDGQYFERALTSVNCYSFLDCSVEAFVKAAMGEIPFGDFSPVKLK